MTTLDAPLVGRVAPSALRPVFSALRIGLHVLVGSLTIFVVVRAVVAGGDQVLAITILAIAFLGTYTVGVLASRQHFSTWTRAGWLIMLLGLWLGLAALTPDAAFLAFPLFFLELHVLPARRAAEPLPEDQEARARVEAACGVERAVPAVEDEVGGETGGPGGLERDRIRSIQERLGFGLFFVEADAAVVVEVVAGAHLEAGPDRTIDRLMEASPVVVDVGEDAWALGAARADGLALTAVFPEPAPEFTGFQRAGFRVRPTRRVLVARSYRRDVSVDWLRANFYTTLGDTDLV